MDFFARYTPAAKRVIYFAHIEARHRDEPDISALDILVGLTWEIDYDSGLLSIVKENAVALRRAIGIPHLPSTALSYRREGVIPLGIDGRKLIAFASEEADDDNQYWIDVDHILRALLRLKGPWREALQDIGMTLESARSISNTLRQSSPPKPTPKFGKARMFLLRKRLSWLSFLILLVIPLLLLLLQWWDR